MENAKMLPTIGVQVTKYAYLVFWTIQRARIFGWYVWPEQSFGFEKKWVIYIYIFIKELLHIVAYDLMPALYELLCICVIMSAPEVETRWRSNSPNE